MPGVIYLIGTPLGNLADLSPRAIETLRSLDVLYCEDTRHTGKLMAHFGLATPLRPLHDDSPPQHWKSAVEQAALGRRIGYATDAGMPGISDPGRRLLRAAWDAGVNPVVIPGPSAVATLASYCPFIQTGFEFIGFAPRKRLDFLEMVEHLTTNQQPLLLFESPLRIHETLESICSGLEAEREMVVGRELTKLYEQVLFFRAGDWPTISEQIPSKGEFTIAIAAAAAKPKDVDGLEAASAVARVEAAGFTRRDALRAAAAVLELPANALKKLSYRE
jgi:16S rRNA (cytidine1402-2'-O)-methyltransferase